MKSSQSTVCLWVRLLHLSFFIYHQNIPYILIMSFFLLEERKIWRNILRPLIFKYAPQGNRFFLRFIRMNQLIVFHQAMQTQGSCAKTLPHGVKQTYTYIYSMLSYLLPTFINQTEVDKNGLNSIRDWPAISLTILSWLVLQGGHLQMIFKVNSKLRYQASILSANGYSRREIY